MQQKSFIVIEALKNTESAQLWLISSRLSLPVLAKKKSLCAKKSPRFEQTH